MPRVEHSKGEGVRRRRIVGVRLWLALLFAAVGTLTGASVYLFVNQSSEQAADERAREVVLGRSFQLARSLGDAAQGSAGQVVAKFRSESFAPFVFNRKGKPQTREEIVGTTLDDIPAWPQLVRQTLEPAEGRVVPELDGDVTVVALPIFRDFRRDGALLVRATRPPEVRSALQTLRGERLEALAIAAGVAALIGFAVASLLAVRVRRLAASAGQIAEGRLDIPLAARGHDEIGDLGRALDSMRVALRGTFDALSSERDRLSAILAALNEAVVVTDRDGRGVRFSNPAAERLVSSNGRVSEPLRPWVRRAVERGTAGHDALQIGDRVYAVHARDLPAEGAALVVVRDRTEELRRELAEREFVSNAAHELRNPIAGISGAVEVLRAGAKDDPEARDHFLERLAEDAERVSRLTRSLLTLARMEAVGEGEAEVVSIDVAAEEAAGAVEIPEGVELDLDLERDLGAQADPALLRQVLIGLVTNAFKNTPAPGTVRVRARRRGEDEILIEVSDTGGGIPSEERDRVFERFYRGSGSLEQEGFGLGLSIAKRMVNVMGGEIGVDSEVGHGSTFWIRLPLAKPTPTPVA